MNILLVTDAWAPLVNGVARTFSQVRALCEAKGHRVQVVSPDQFRTVPCPGYPQIPLALFPSRKLREVIDEFRPDAVHIATEGPLGLAARNILVRRRLPFTTSYATRFPEYVAARLPVPLGWGYAAMRWFHAPSRAVMVATETLRRELAQHGFANIRRWSRGVDAELFRPGLEPALELPRPVWLTVGRVAVEKNIEAFLRLDLPGTRLVVGDGPQLDELRRRFPDAVFAGARHGEDLVRHYAAADVFVFPSRTDTFGLVLLEALACGVPVAAFPVPGPIDVIDGAAVGILDADLAQACERAIAIPRQRCRDYALNFSWSAVADQFLANLHPF